MIEERLQPIVYILEIFLVSWSSKKQSVVPRSSTKSEYRSLAHTTAEVSWIQSLLSEINQHSRHTPVVW